MHQVEYWRWRYRDPETGRVCRTMFQLTAEEAAKYPDAERIPGTLLLRDVEVSSWLKRRRGRFVGSPGDRTDLRPAAHLPEQLEGTLMNRPSQSRSERIEELRESILQHEYERDAWQGRSEHNFQMASRLVEALQRELALLQSDA